MLCSSCPVTQVPLAYPGFSFLSPAVQLISFTANSMSKIQFITPAIRPPLTHSLPQARAGPIHFQFSILAQVFLRMLGCTLISAQGSETLLGSRTPVTLRLSTTSPQSS